MGFKDLKITAQFIRAIEALGFTEPTPIQQKAIPMILGGQDLIGVAPTGTGKTAAFGLPILQAVKYAQGDHPRALIVAPSRELAIQGCEKLQELAVETDLRIGVIYGGKGTLQKQRVVVDNGLDILVGTPGRIMELYFEGRLILKGLQFLVLDEADKMMDMGFMPQIRNLLEIVPRKRQNLLFSATFSERVEGLSHEFLEFPNKVEVQPQATPVDTVTQYIFKVPNRRTKIELLHYLFDNEEMEKVMVFARTREAAEQITRFLERKIEGEVRTLHANKGQNSRINAINDFRNEEIKVLVATDVASRGLDVPRVSHVINFDIPLVHEDYIHRIGRTGRAGASGTAWSFVSKTDEYHLGKVQEKMGMEVDVLPMPEEVTVYKTDKDEAQAMARELDDQRKKLDPDFKGAFHEKKKRFKKWDRMKKDASLSASQKSGKTSAYRSSKKKKR